MINKWNKLRIVIEWLEQGRILEVGDINYGISENGDILHMYTEDEGVELPTLKHYWNLIEKIPDDRLFIMSSETALTNIGKEKAQKRNYCEHEPLSGDDELTQICKHCSESYLDMP